MDEKIYINYSRLEKIILEKMINSPGQTFSRDEIGSIIKLDKAEINLQVLKEEDLINQIFDNRIINSLDHEALIRNVGGKA